MKWFISQPMSGRTEEEILDVREEITKKIKEKDPHAEIIDSYHKEWKPTEGGNQHIKYLAKAIEMMADADIVWMAEEWGCARGCNAEYNIASMYGLIVYDSTGY